MDGAAHDLAYLVDQTSDSGGEVPQSLSGLEWLTPWGVQFRCDAAEMTLDRTAAVMAAEAAIAWATKEIGC